MRRKLWQHPLLVLAAAGALFWTTATLLESLPILGAYAPQKLLVRTGFLLEFALLWALWRLLSDPHE